MVKKIPKTQYPKKIENSYAKNVTELVNELNGLFMYEFENVIAPMIRGHRLIADDTRNDSIIDNIRKAINKIEALALGAFPDFLSKRAAKKFVNGVSTVNKTNINTQLRVKGVNPIESEDWLKPFLEAKVQENVSYITKIRDDQMKSVEQIILRGFTSGQSTSSMGEEIEKATSKSRAQAEFIARDQTGSLLGQITAERHKRSGGTAFRWSDSGDSKVRDSHAAKHGKIFFYEDNPLLPGEDYGCRCVAEMVDEFDEDFVKALETRDNVNVASNLIKEAEQYEPQITDDLSAITIKSNASLEGLDFRLKTQESLARKISNEPNGKKIKDILRYTSVSEAKNHTISYNETIESLKGKGYTLTVVKNYWNNPQNPYNGINTFVSSPDGYEFELQFHTPESFKLKNGKLHELYERQRVLDPIKDAVEINELSREMAELSSKLIVPKNIYTIGGAK